MGPPVDTVNRSRDRVRKWPYRTYMAAIISIAAAWPWSAVLVPALWPRYLYLLIGVVLLFAFVAYASRFGEKLRSHRGLAPPPDETARNEVPPQGIELALDLASLAYDDNGKLSLSRVAYVVNLGSFLAALNLLVPLPTVAPCWGQLVC